MTTPAHRDARHCAYLIRRSRQRGVTLYESIVTMAIAAVLAGIGIPAFQSLLANTRLTTATNTLLAALATTRSEAIKRGERVVMCPSADYRSCTGNSDWDVGYALYVDNNGNGELDAGEPMLRTFDPLPRVSVRTSVYRDHVTYQPSGLASGSNLSYAVCAEGAASGRAVVVSNTGRARVARRMPDGGLPCPPG